jgi:lipoprotein-anchoring transpeptidase ErfK/SrfK
MPAPLRTALLALAVPLLAAGCRVERTEREAAQSDTLGVATAGGYEAFTASELEQGRYSGRFRAVAQVDTALARDAARSNPERLEDINEVDFDSARVHLPLGGDVAGPSVLYAQILLDRAGFSAGEIDGQWGDNTEKAVYWFQEAEGLRPTGVIDSLTHRRLRARAGRPAEAVTTYRLTAQDVAGPFEDIPDDIYEKAEMDSLGYASLAEMLGERFHAAPDLLRRLNPGVNLNRLAADDPLRVPNVEGARQDRGQPARLVISGRGEYLHAVDAGGRILYHFPTTLGAAYDPSPQGDYTVTGVAINPRWHYQPAILEDVPDDEEDAMIPPGPNNAVGRVWMALSEPHYGIHGTSAPETIGYASSAGCVRLTNWDALFLAARVGPGLPVTFRDITGRGTPTAPDSAAARPDTGRVRPDTTRRTSP